VTLDNYNKSSFNLGTILKDHEKFSSLFYDINKLDKRKKEELLKTLCLCLHHEVSSIAESSNFKIFEKTSYDVDINSILYNSVDVLRYVFSILNLYGIDADKFNAAYREKAEYLHFVSTQDKNSLDSGRVIVIDIDDVICDFRSYFNSWINKTYNIEIRDDSTSYYSSIEVKKIGLSPELVFKEFINSNQLLNIPVIENMKLSINVMKKSGFKICLLTSRPEANPKCKYQTYKWLIDNDIKFDSLNFSPEKYIWIAKQKFYVEERLFFAIDDSPKHAMEYATHDILTVVPKASYNSDVTHRNIMLCEKKDILFLLNDLIKINIVV
jgi:hypothetical protein